MRTTLTIEEDVAALLEREMRRTGKPLKQVVNRLLRSGLQQTAVSGGPKHFVVKPKKIGLPRDWTSGSISELIEMLEGPLSR